MTQRIRLSRAKGWRLPEGAVNVARPGKWGNPFVVGRDGTRAQCVAKFYVLAKGFIALHGPVSVKDQLAMHRRLKRSIGALRGKDLACWCALDGAPCHADVLLSLANGTRLPPWANRPVELPSVRLGMSAADLEKLERKAKARETAE